MQENYISISLFIVSLAIVFLSLYGVRLSEIEYYRKGISFIFMGFIVISIELFLGIINILDAPTLEIFRLIGYLFVLIGILVLTLVRKRLGI